MANRVPIGKTRWWRLQFKLRTLAILTVVAAIGFAGWRHWESTRAQREFVAAIQGAEFYSAEEKELFSALVWQSEEEGLLTTLYLSAEFKLDHETIWLVELLGPHLRFSATSADSQGQARRVFIIESQGAPVILITDERYCVLHWIDAQWEEKAMFRFASVGDARSNPELKVILGPFYGHGVGVTHHYQLADHGILKLPAGSTQAHQ